MIINIQIPGRNSFALPTRQPAPQVQGNFAADQALISPRRDTLESVGEGFSDLLEGLQQNYQSSAPLIQLVEVMTRLLELLGNQGSPTSPVAGSGVNLGSQPSSSPLSRINGNFLGSPQNSGSGATIETRNSSRPSSAQPASAPGDSPSASSGSSSTGSSGEAQTSSGPEWASKLPEPLRALGPAFEKYGKQYGVDPRFLAAVSMFETGNGTSTAFRNKKNAMGVSNANGPISFTDVDLSIEQMARVMASATGPYKSAHTVDEIGKVYAPVGAGNDPNNTNGHWPKGVAACYRQLGGDPSKPVK